ncbi:MAG: nucleotide exchange factor GrpE [Firmicutes bacterium]|nr:nucleotide exchange factor GrpE [Bacillota bacterium]
MDTKKEDLFEQQLEECPEEIEVLDPPNLDLKYKEMEDRYQRSLAEFDNYRKRTIKEMSARYNDGVSYACEKLIPMVDNFERALNACEDKENGFYQGVAMIARQFEGILCDLGVNEIPLEPGDKFDPNFHNAVAHVEDENFGQNEVALVLQKGYIHKDKVLRHSVVKVAN